MNKLNTIISNRFSPKEFSDKLITEEEIQTLFEAARWAASCYGEQPWRFVYALKEDKEAFNNILDCLVEANQEWAKHAPALICAVSSNTFERNDNPNGYSWHDVGLAVGNLSAQATSMSIFLHQMAGFDSSKAIKNLNIPKNHSPLTIMALGYLPEEFDLTTFLLNRPERKGLDKIVFKSKFK